MGIKVRQIFGAQVSMTSTPFRKEKVRAKVMASVTIVKEKDTLHVSARHLGAREKRGQETVFWDARAESDRFTKPSMQHVSK